MKKTSIKIALIISLLFISMLSILNFIVVWRSRDAFIDVVGSIRFQNGQGVLQQKISEDFSIIKYNPDGSIRSTPLQEEFQEKFQSSLLLVGGLGILISLIVGVLASHVITYPLRSISDGIAKLRKNNYKQKLEMTDIEEIDVVIEEFNNLTDELQKIEDLRNDLISDTSHELKTPLTSLNAQLEGIKDGVLMLDKNRIKVLIGQVQRLTDLVQKMEEYSRLKNKTLELKIEKIPMSKLLDEIKFLFDEKMNSKNITLKIDVPKKLSIKADKSLLERILINLLDNAIKYSESKVICIKCTQDFISVIDDGKGIPLQDQPYIFERFYRVEKSRNRKTGGLGLGLSLVREIVESHGWKVEVISPVIDNKGSEFRISIHH